VRSACELHVEFISSLSKFLINQVACRSEGGRTLTTVLDAWDMSS
jgi:hypothetical protein